jgi:DNA replication protein DnaC
LTEKDREIEQVPVALRAAVRSCATGERSWPLVVIGPVGVGKTCAGLCVLDYTGGFYYTAQGLAEDMIQAMKGQLATPRGSSVSQAQLWRELKQSALVVLDEVGDRTKASDHAYDCLKRLLDGREEAPLLVLTNLGLPEIAAVYDDRITSRLAAGTLVRLNGPDRRLER